MKYFLTLCLFGLTACHFAPLYSNSHTVGVCVAPIPEESGYKMRHILQQYFPDTSNCSYTLQVLPPITLLSDQSISDKDFITMQQIQTSTSYKLLDTHKEIVLENTLSTKGSSAIVANPYASVVATEKTENNLEIALAEQIALHVMAFLNRNTP